MELDLQNEYMTEILEALARSYFTTLVVDVPADRYQVVHLTPNRGECRTLRAGKAGNTPAACTSS